MTAQETESLFADIEELALEVTEEQYKIQPELMERYGRPGFEKSRRDAVYTLHYLAESVQMDSPSLFVHYIGWLKQLLAGYGLNEKDIRIKLELILGRIRAAVQGEERERAVRILEMGILRMSEPAEQPSYISEEQPLGQECRAYLDALLRRDRSGAYALIDAAIASGASLREVYRHIFQTSQYEVGRLWQTQQISVADEHYCSAVTQSAMSRLYADWIGLKKQDRTGVLVSACIGGEMHEIGLRMLTDVFELEGWETHYLGSRVDEEELIETAAKSGADLIALSATMTFHVHLMKKQIARLRADERLAGVKIMVGGLPFNVDAALWRRVGADGYSPDADRALLEAGRLMRMSRSERERTEDVGAEGGHA
ncbi:B12-binding domain-containing protein [Saccharibacillus sp. O23]|uniref:cobalamin B12-binding domain-containing protein n=1 Tax=Saccharibacillus sp. O23 TaxID=2009338 RepID=UPI0015C5CEA6|nr:cobalamin-dependent protein [Saccharibacillus sp. O23]